MRVCLIASHRHPVREPFAGGLEAMTHLVARGLAARGHDVLLFAGPGCDPDLPVTPLRPARFHPSEAAAADVNAPEDRWMAEHHAYLDLMLALSRGEHGHVDVVHNHSLHHLPVALAGLVPAPVVTTLHTPPLPWLESAAKLDRGATVFTAVSAHTAKQWSHVREVRPVLNGIDVEAWTPGPGGERAVWTGRLVPEKAPHEAIDAARSAGVPLVLAGPVGDREYVEREVWPRLGDDVEYAGHLAHRELVRLVGGSRVALVTPAWDEPYGLVAAEAMACGTPVAAYARGGLPEVIAPGAGALATPHDRADLAEALHRAARCDRAAVREHARANLSLERMLEEYEQVYAEVRR